MSDDPTRLLIVDDSALYRQTIRNVLHDVEGVSIVGVAGNGIDALKKIEDLSPDLLTLDVQMPDMDGIGVLREMNRRRMRPGAIMVSSLTAEGAQVTTDALLEGAFDFILKPAGDDAGENRQRLRDELDEKIRAFRQTEGRAEARRRRPAPPAEPEADVEPSSRAFQCVLIGTSTGGPAALKEVLPRLRADLGVPVLVVQHMPPQYTRSLARRLDEGCALDVAEASDGMEARPGTVLIAPGGRHMKLLARDHRILVRITDEPHVQGCRPSVDYTLRSLVKAVDGQALAAILTGMGRDGVEGCRMLRERGGCVLVQDEDSSMVYGMPKAVAEEGLADRVLSLKNMGPSIMRHVERSRRSRQGTP